MALVLLTSQAEGFEFSGSLKPGMELATFGGGDDGYHFVALSPFRLIVRHDLGGIRLNAAYTLSPSAGDPAVQEFGGGDGPSPYRILDLEEMIVPSERNPGASFSLLQNLDRFSVRFRLPFATLTAGRQAVYWGISRSVSPTDFIAPFQYGTLDTEYRVGVDAVRAVFPTGMLSEVDTGWLFGRDADPALSGGWLRGRFYVLRSDVTLLAGFFRENLIFGGSVNRAIGGATGWIEAAAVSTDALSEGSAERGTSWSLSAGWERSWFQATLSAYIEYHFNSAGTSDPDKYLEIRTTLPYTEGDLYLLGKHYLAPGASFLVTPLLRMDIGALVNPADPSAYLSLEASYGITEDMTLSAGIRRGIGRGSGDNGEPRSEFGDWPGAVHLSAAWYF